MQGYDMLAVNRLSAVLNALLDIRTIPQTLRFLSRTPLVNAVDEEILARFTGYILAADLIADDQAAVARATGKFELETNKIPNLKHGSIISQSMLNMLARINAGGGIPNDQGILSDYRNRLVDGLLLGVRQRMNALIVAMQLDAFSYDRLGIKISGATWGMPSDLKVTPNTAWTDATNATPIDTIMTLTALAREKYGESYNRLTMSSTAFRYMIATAEFRNKAMLYSQYVLPTAASFPIADIPMMTALAGRILNMEIELEDTQYWTQSSAGALSSTPYLPANKVILSSKSDDNNTSAMDFANGIVTESIVGSVASNLIGSFSGPQYGPVSYVTGPSDMNPPSMVAWGVARGWPRKHRLSATAVITTH